MVIPIARYGSGGKAGEVLISKACYDVGLEYSIAALPIVRREARHYGKRELKQVTALPCLSLWTEGAAVCCFAALRTAMTVAME